MFTALRCLLTTCLVWTCTADAGAQFNETFNDGSLQTPLYWRDTTGWVQDGGFLRSAETREQYSFAIYTVATNTPVISELEWQVKLRLAFNPSSTNYLDWFLAADTAPGQARNSYYVRIGNTRDEISLYRLRNGLATEIISGRDGRLNRSVNPCIIRVRCRENRHWKLEVVDAERSAWEMEGVCDDAFITLPPFHGFRVRQSTVAFHQRHYIDEVYFGAARYDTIPPQLKDAAFQSDGRLRLRFSEALSALSDPGSEHYWLDGRGGPDSILAGADPVFRFLLWKNRQAEVGQYQLHLGGFRDTAGNRTDNAVFYFWGGLPDTPQRGQLLITEIMAAPEAGQPEWVEIQNVHNRWIGLKGIRFHDATGGILLPDTWLAPGERAILLPQNASGPIGKGKNLRLNLPSLNNSGDTLSLRSAGGQWLHRVAYSDGWYGNPVLASGGYSLEMVDTSVWCGDARNWKASLAPERSTPGLRNSVAAALNDTVPPRLCEVYPESPFVLRLAFDEWPDITTLRAENFIVQPGYIVADQLMADEGKQEVRLQFASPFSSQQVYSLQGDGAADCSGNTMPANLRYFAMAADSIRRGDLLINEVLFEPATGGVDFVELHNPGPKALDLKALELLRLDAAGTPVEAIVLAKNGQLLLPGGFLAICENSEAVMGQFPCHGSDTAFLLLKPMPALLAGGGQIAIRRRDGTEIDRMAFHPRMHHPLLHQAKGISLERVSASVSGMDPANWQSAGRECSGGTPGRRNAQARTEPDFTAQMQLDVEWFTPDNDGHADFAALHYRFSQPGTLLTLRVYDAWGMPVRALCLHQLCGTEGMVVWDGLREDGRPAPAGNYILMAEAQDAAGRQEKAKLLLSLLRSQ
ncbi:MAG: lamin tail domain-containing protein [Bacteroidota bacterium]